MKTMKNYAGALLAGSLMVACAGHDDGENSSALDLSAKSKSSCAPMTTLECAHGFEVTEDGCAQSRVAGAAPLGRCVEKQTYSCAPMTTLECAHGFEATEDGCPASHARCVPPKTCSPGALGSLQPGSTGGPDRQSIVSCTAGYTLCKIDPNGSDGDVCSDPNDCYACTK
jgi:hypothetical protein